MYNTLIRFTSYYVLTLKTFIFYINQESQQDI